ncbi:MAG: DUF5916 domain-containing protein [Gemmatimonadaceae bacterium]
MRTLLSTAVVVLAAASLHAQQPVYNARLGATRIAVPHADESETVTIDGRLSEGIWTRASVLTGFSTYAPADGTPAEDSTQVLVWYTATAIYFGVRAYEPHGPPATTVRATVAKRDQIDAEDNVQLLIDTFDDHRKAYVFAVTPLGGQADGIRSEGGGSGPTVGGQGFGANTGGNTIDLNPDFAYESKGRVTEWGYEVEVRIPFKSLRYPSAPVENWGLQIIRQVQHSGHQDTWTPATRASASFLRQSGTLAGLTGMRRGLVLEVNPEARTHVTGDSGAAAGAGWRYTNKPELGGNVRWGVTSDLTLDGTIKPDFSQVEADATQIASDPRFALFYPEKRPFFVDGIEQFDAPNRLIYTRRIVQPVTAAKLTGKVGGTSIGALLAEDDRLGSASGREHPAVGVLRLRRDIGGSSWAGLTYTGRTEPGYYSQLASLDARVVFGTLYYAQLQATSSVTRVPGATVSGPQFEGVIDRTGRTFGFHYTLAGIHPNFVAAEGFVPRVDLVKASMANRFTVFGAPKGLLETWVMRISLDGTWTYDDFFNRRAVLEEYASYDNSFTLRGGWTLGLTPGWAGVAFDPRKYTALAITRPSAGGTDTLPFAVGSRVRAAKLAARVQTPQFRRFAGSVSVLIGNDVDFFETARARRTDITAGLDWRPTARLRVSPSYARSVYARPGGGTFSTTDIPRLKIEYQHSRALLARIVGQYDAESRDALRDPATGRLLLIRSSSTATYAASAPLRLNGLRGDALLSYQPTPGTVVFAGYGSTFTEPDALRFDRLRRTDDGFFLKLSYVFRL